MGFTIGSSRSIREIRSGTRRRGRVVGVHRRGRVHRPLGLGRGRRRPRGGRRLLLRPDRLPRAGRPPAGLRAPGRGRRHARRSHRRLGPSSPAPRCMLPVGRAFDVIEVAEPAGRHALVRLERMGLPLGPVTATPEGRAQFFVAPGAAAELPELLYRMGWDDAALDLHGLGAGTYSRRPPPTGAASARSAGSARPPWTRRPSPRRPGCCWGRWPTWRTGRGRSARASPRGAAQQGARPQLHLGDGRLFVGLRISGRW